MKKIALSLVVIAASGAYVWSQSGGGGQDDPLASLTGNADVLTGSIDKPEPTAVSVPVAPSARVPSARIMPAVEREWSDDDGWEHEGDEESEGEHWSALLPSGDILPSPNSPALSAANAPAVAPAPETPLTPEPAPIPSPPAEAAVVPVAPETPDLPSAPPPAIVDARLPRPRPAYQAPPASAGVTRVAARLVPGGQFVDGTYTGPAVDAYYGLVQIQAIVQRGQLVDIAVLQYPSDRRLSVRINRYALPRLRDEVISAQSAEVDIISGATLTSWAFMRSLGSALGSAGA
jgi:uncharacterized protein with FMN-binding domain